MNTPPAEEWTFATAAVGRRVLVFDELDSTNTFAAALPADAADGLVVVARDQTAGRGRFGRPWRSRPGSALLMSVLLSPPPALRRPVILTAWAAVAVAAAVREMTGVDARIKWPNDLFACGKKVCGILIEQGATAGPDPRFRTIAGVGLNLAQTADEFAALGLPAACSLGMLGAAVGLRDAAESVVRNLDATWARLTGGDYAGVEAEWAGRIGLVGGDVLLDHTDGTRRAGRLLGLGFGGLDLEHADGRVERFAAEAVEHVRAAGG